jgi:P-loop Domain of unknown function (DUF2791)
MSPNAIRPRERDAILQALRAGVVPRVGQRHVQVGRANEVQALLNDIDRVADGGTAIRFVIGEYGSGKTFFLQLVRSIAMERKLVTIHADLSPDRRLYATGGQARSLFAELMRNISTRAKPDGGAMSSIVERFIGSALNQAKGAGTSPETVIQQRLADLSEMVGGYDFAEVIGAYWRGCDTGSERLKIDAVRWLRGEFSTRTDARAALGVRTIVDDANLYDQIKLMSRLVRLAGFAGLLVCLDEMVNLYKLANTQARNSNYEQILRILNDSLQGNATRLGFVFGGTPDFLLDTRRGLYSYPALQSRLAENTYAANGLVDYSGPVLRLANLSKEDFYLLLTRLRHVVASGNPAGYLIPDQGLTAFMAHCSTRIGDAYFRTPRTTIKEFVNLLAVLEQNPGADWASLIGSVDILPESNPDLAPLPSEAAAGSSDPEPPVAHTAMPATPRESPIRQPIPSSGDEDNDLATFRL